MILCNQTLDGSEFSLFIGNLEIIHVWDFSNGFYVQKPAARLIKSPKESILWGTWAPRFNLRLG